ncbi:universal stress protein [Halorientalis brevis]|uniref:Universal stress protein n=1 Tax=Halorientalis brevis TaxID=1126241 RepID=A0ABD6C757_9EURY|nr:universal stress protein [Halorientalis brevis]
MYDNILVPTDGSDCARGAAAHAMTVADAFGATVHALSVVDPMEYASGSVGDVSDLVDRERETFFDRASEATAAIADIDPSVDVEQHTRQGTPHEIITEFVEAHGIDLVVMGTHGRTGPWRHLLGSVTERTVRTVTAPVLTVHGECQSVAYDDVLVPTDGSEYADAALEHAIALADAFDATPHVLHAGDADHGRAAVADARDRIVETTGREPVTEIASGAPSAVIDSYATDADVDLVVMGTHGRTGLSRRVLGSVTERTIRTTTHPVLAVHTDDAAPEQ